MLLRKSPPTPLACLYGREKIAKEGKYFSSLWKKREEGRGDDRR
jgi:hypothetical protein